LGKRYEVPYELIGKTVQLASILTERRSSVLSPKTAIPWAGQSSWIRLPTATAKEEHETSPRRRTGANLVEMALEWQTRGLCGNAPLPKTIEPVMPFEK